MGVGVLIAYKLSSTFSREFENLVNRDLSLFCMARGRVEAVVWR